jgi:hypothetical protein
MNAPPPVAAGAGAQPQTSGLAIASLILGIASIVMCLGPLAGIPAVIIGHKANSDIRKSGGVIQGGGMATAGLVTGYLSIFMIALWGLMAAVAIPNFVKARKAAQAEQCKATLNIIQDAKQAWAKEDAKSDDAVPFDAELFGPGKTLSQKPQCPAGGTYMVNSVKEEPSCTMHGSISGGRR